MPQHSALTHLELYRNPKVTQVTHYSMPGTTRHWLLAARGVAYRELDQHAENDSRRSMEGVHAT